MGKIRVLSEQLSNRIAAGEVIERPASVVKELVENAIDAGATRITVEVEGAGSRLIAVTDNGCGMDSDDAMMCLEPHGTSKIREASDIDRIMTLGFRGEAIPSIASVSRFTLCTRTAEAKEGFELQVEGGIVRNAAPAGAPVGTAIKVRDIFFNVPARKKFLKSPATEEHHIEEMLLMLALPCPEISFELIMNGRMAINSPGAETLDLRLREFFGKNFASQMLPVEYRENSLLIHGYIAAPGFTRTSRREQRTFVNGRAVESLAIYRGLRDGYATLAESGRFPPCVLFVQMPPADVDVNVHPAKREVRFKQEFTITRAVAGAVANALKKRQTPQSTLDYRVPMESFLGGAEISYEPEAPQPELIEVTEPEIRQIPEIPPQKERIHKSDEKVTEDFAVAELPVFPPPKAEKVTTEVTELPSLTDEDKVPEPVRPMPEKIVFNGDWPTEVIGVLDKTYIVASGNAGLVLIDQHAAHERILFEKLQRDVTEGVPSQNLLIPITLDLPRNAAQMMWKSRELFISLGFDIEPMGNSTIMLNAIPAALPAGDWESVLLDVLDELIENSAAKLPLELDFVARAACKAAIKAHDFLTPEMAANLLEQLGRCRQGTLCPHGRPTMLTITLSEIERRFGRK